MLTGFSEPDGDAADMSRFLVNAKFFFILIDLFVLIFSSFLIWFTSSSFFAQIF
jgi:hypothetical protein